MYEEVHDQIFVRAPKVDGPNRDGEILEAHGPDGGPPYVVRWSDNSHQGLYWPSSDSVIHHHVPTPESPRVLG